ncbi:MAG: tRNA 2-thiouridine(34) synthase MnmA [Candidatus Cryosericum sp.]
MSIVVGMSGGTDSAVAALLLRDAQEQVIGVTLHFSDRSHCCDLASTRRARAQCEHLGIPWHQIDMSLLFESEVVIPFWRGIAAGGTPNPCLLCNERVKWQGLLDAAHQLGADLVASGHYAGIVHSPDGDLICRGKDAAKDQSYFLYRLSPEVRKRAVFPLAGRLKRDVKSLAAESFPAELLAQRESQDLCFLVDSLAVETRRRVGGPPGPVLLSDGTVVGRHEGLASYTIGQRSGLGISSGERLYVVEKRQSDNQLIVGTRSECMRDTFEVAELRWQHLPTARLETFTSDVVTRYRARPVTADVKRLSDDRALIHTSVPVFAVTPGQAAVFYQDRFVLGGGTIV